MSGSQKVYVDVKVKYFADGRVQPLSIIWEDGHEYEIGRVLGVCRAASLKAGGAGLRYTVRIGRTETHLFFEETRWFVERRA